MGVSVGAIRVAVCANGRRATQQLARAATGLDSTVVARASGVGELDLALRDGGIEVVVLGDGIPPADTGTWIKCAWPGTKVVGLGEEVGGGSVDAWAAEPGEVPTAILTTFLY